MKLWRCENCGKWSHAQRQPKRHQRFISAADMAEDQYVDAKASMEVNDLPVFRFEEPWYSGDPNGGEGDGGFWVWCGPFDVWTATRS